jgi:hypothetical protein
MNISEKQLKRVIQEELNTVLYEVDSGFPETPPGSEHTVAPDVRSTTIEVMCDPDTPGGPASHCTETDIAAAVAGRTTSAATDLSQPMPSTVPKTAGEELTQALLWDADDWVGYTAQDVNSELREMGINPVHGWWRGKGRGGRLEGKPYPKRHPARIKYSTWYKWRKGGGRPDPKELARRAAGPMSAALGQSEFLKEGLKKRITSSSLKNLIKEILKTEY